MKIDSPELKRFREMVVDLNVQWQMFEKLFSDAQNYPIFDRTGPNFWIHLRSYLLDMLFQSISRFFDPRENHSQTNLSLATIIALQEVAPIRSELESHLESMRPIWDRGIRIWRHKKLSHSDMPTALGTVPLPDIPISEVKDLISGISEFVREIDHRLNQVDVSYHISVSQWVPQILGYLEQGVRKTDEDLKRANQPPEPTP